jgi:hypothetical protein
MIILKSWQQKVGHTFHSKNYIRVPVESVILFKQLIETEITNIRIFSSILDTVEAKFSCFLNYKLQIGIEICFCVLQGNMV